MSVLSVTCGVDPITSRVAALSSCRTGHAVTVMTSASVKSARRGLVSPHLLMTSFPAFSPSARPGRLQVFVTSLVMLEMSSSHRSRGPSQCHPRRLGRQQIFDRLLVIITLSEPGETNLLVGCDVISVTELAVFPPISAEHGTSQLPLQPGIHGYVLGQVAALVVSGKLQQQSLLTRKN